MRVLYHNKKKNDTLFTMSISKWFLACFAILLLLSFSINMYLLYSEKNKRDNVAGKVTENTSKLSDVDKILSPQH